MSGSQSEPTWRKPIRETILVMVAAALGGCGGGGEVRGRALGGGDPAAGRELVARYGCTSCHAIDGVSGSRGMVGPSLIGFAGRSYIAGAVSNTPEHLVAWLRDPPGMVPGTAMPNLGVSDAEARHLASYLYSRP